MAIKWDISKCKNWNELNKGVEWDITWGLICSDGSGYSRITKNNYKKYYARLRLSEKLFGTMLYIIDKNKKQVRYFITLEDVKRRIGLQTNSSDKTDAEFWKHIKKSVYKDGFE